VHKKKKEVPPSPKRIKLPFLLKTPKHDSFDFLNKNEGTYDNSLSASFLTKKKKNESEIVHRLHENLLPQGPSPLKKIHHHSKSQSMALKKESKLILEQQVSPTMPLDLSISQSISHDLSRFSDLNESLAMLPLYKFSFKVNSTKQYSNYYKM